jgi:hypothetical protein
MFPWKPAPGIVTTGALVIGLAMSPGPVEAKPSPPVTAPLEALEDVPDVTARDRVALGVGTPAPPRPPVDEPLGRAVSGTVHGTVLWTDPEGHEHPVRGALVQIVDGGPSGPLLRSTATGANGEYSAASVSATTNQVTVIVFSVDDSYDAATGYGAIARVYPRNQPSTFYNMFIGPSVMSLDVTVDMTAPRTQRGTPTHPDSTHNTTVWRAFAVFDAMRTYWYQASALLRRRMATAQVAFPSTQCGTASCFDPANTPWELHVLSADAYDWDVLGREFTRFLMYAHRFGVPPRRLLADSPGGPHTGGSAIGQAGRNREQGMRLAWEEGLATALALILQQAPLATVSPFPANLLNLADGRYSDTEDTDVVLDAEAPVPSDGYASEFSVLAVLWDLFDTRQDSLGGVTDSIAGIDARTLWDALTRTLACDPCDRIDRLWTSVLKLLDFPNTLNPAVFEVAKLFVINHVAPRALSPGDGAIVDDTPPRFEWSRNGDSSPDHWNDRFALVISRDDFQGHVKILWPPPGSEAYSPTQGEWNDIRQGGAPASVYKWFVAGWASAKGDGNPEIPEGGLPWISNPMTFAGQARPRPSP